MAQQDQIMAVIPLDEVNTSANAIPWLSFIHNITENYTLIQDDSLILLNDAYVRQLNLLLAGTSKRCFINYRISLRDRFVKNIYFFQYKSVIHYYIF